MKKIDVRKIYLLDFEFNPKSRILQHADTTMQLRKKQADVLALLCEKYPEPVSQAEFLAEVWGGGYVTSQSIAQVIRSLRISLNDDTKSIIVTIPKLGYQLSVQPCWQEPEAVQKKYAFESFTPGTNDIDNFSFSTQPVMNNDSVRATPMGLMCYSSRGKITGRKKCSPQILFVSAMAALFVVIYMLP